MASAYNPRFTEHGWYDWWESKGYFKPKNNRKVFTLLLPPPNVTGTLHLGHALTLTIQDVFIRWMRMKGQNVLWVPGFDHAGIATQVAVEKYLKSVMNVTKYDLGKKEFLQKVIDWKVEKENVIIQQVRQIGASVDWSKKYFTMDSTNAEAVSRAFIHLYNKDLIYRHNELVNWCCFLKSGVSDIEVNWKEISEPSKISLPGYRKLIEFGYMYKIAYKVWSDCNKEEEIVIATTRPETLLGDTAIAVHPNDKRYNHLKYKYVWHPFRKCKIPIVFDEDVNSDMGTGAVKITPAHSPKDFIIARRHNLEVLDVIDEGGHVKEENYYSQFQGMKLYDAREKILNELENLGLYRGKYQHAMTIPICSRSGDVIEYLAKPQWFLKCSGMYDKVRLAIANKDVTIEPEHCVDQLLNWFKYGRDWNLSRQLWWGHQIPMYECQGENESIWIPAVTLDEAKAMASKKLKIDCAKVQINQDPDVLDTWFSSGILPFSLSGWPNRTSEFYPLDLMETGQDIVFFWVARMLMLGLEVTGQVPFRRVVLHGLICDSYGRKMSKSLGNVVLPEDVINGISLEEMKAQVEKNHRLGILSASERKLSIEGQKKMFPTGIPECGTDALRLTLCADRIKGDQLNFNIDVCRANRFFCNKMWQSLLYFIKSTRSKSNLSAKIDDKQLSILENWILSSLATAVESVNTGIADFEYHSAVIAIRYFFIKQFCDIYLEASKSVLTGNSNDDCGRVIATLFTCLETSFRLLSPFMPFVTEELYHCLPKMNEFVRAESIAVAEFPDPSYWVRYKNPEVDKLMMGFTEILTSLRSMRNVYKLSKQKPKLILSLPDCAEDLLSDELIKLLKKQTGVEEISRANDDISFKNVIVRTIGDYKLYLYHEHNKNTLQKMFETSLEKEDNVRESLQKLNATISNPNYETETPVEIKRKNLSAAIHLTEELKKIEEVKEVIERAR